MSRHGALANIDLPIRKKLAQVIVGPAVAEPQLEHVTLEAPHQSSRQIEAGALRLKAADKAVQPAHDRSSGDPGLFAQSIDFGVRRAQLMVHRIDPLRQFPHDRNRHGREFADHAHERLL